MKRCLGMENPGMIRQMHRYRHILLLMLVLLTAAGFRFYELQWDREMDAFPHPDERHLANTLSHVTLSWPPDWRSLLDADHSTLNPRRVNPDDPAGGHYDLAYGTLPVYLYRFLTAVFPGHQGQYRQFFVVGRITTALMSLLTVLLVYLLGRALGGRREGLLGAALLALSVTHIQLSHFMTVDIALTTFGTAAVYAGARLVMRGGWWRALIMGLMVGCAAACKVSGFTYGAVIAAVGLLILLKPGDERIVLRLGRALGYMALASLGVALAFGTLEFYALLDPATYLEAIGRQAEMVRGQVDWPYTRQYVNTAPYWYHLENLLRWGLGWALGIAGLAGVLTATAYLVWLLLRRPQTGARGVWGRVQAVTGQPARWGLFLILAWALPYFFQVGGYEVKFVRYMVPLVPFLCLMAGWLLIKTAGMAGRLAERLPETAWGRAHLPRLGVGWALDKGRWNSAAGVLVIAAVLVPTLLWALAFMSVYAHPHTWYQASRWIYANAPDGSVFSEEIWDDSLPVSLPAEGEVPDRHGYRHVPMNIYHDMPPAEKLQHIASVLRQVDYVVLATPRLYGSVRRLPWRYPVEIRYYELLFQGRLGFELAYAASSYPRLWGKEFPDDAADESFSVYDHPRVLIFRKVRDLSEEEFRSLFTSALQSTPLVRRDVKEPPAELPVPQYRKSLMLDRPVDELPAVHDWAWNPLANAGTGPAVLVWLAVLMIVGLAAWPLAALLFPDMPG
ncbi:MAG: glycosyltransferase family 39 protein, partial [Anaerolineae bacterium]